MTGRRRVRGPGHRRDHARADRAGRGCWVLGRRADGAGAGHATDVSDPHAHPRSPDANAGESRSREPTGDGHPGRRGRVHRAAARRPAAHDRERTGGRPVRGRQPPGLRHRTTVRARDVAPRAGRSRGAQRGADPARQGPRADVDGDSHRDLLVADIGLLGPTNRKVGRVVLLRNDGKVRIRRGRAAGGRGASGVRRGGGPGRRRRPGHRRLRIRAPGREGGLAGADGGAGGSSSTSSTTGRGRYTPIRSTPTATATWTLQSRCPRSPRRCCCSATTARANSCGR